MPAKYIIRLDDACPTMNLAKWQQLEDIFDLYNIKPIMAVIPHNEDQSLVVDKPNANFWKKVKAWQNKNYKIALHGYNHVYISSNGGLIPKNNDSEFAGLPLKIQLEKIKKGIEIFKNHNIETNIWVAPSHTFDLNTLKALKTESSINIISDGIALGTYKLYDFNWIPQQISSPYKMPFGLWTICLHPNNMSENDIENIKLFIQKNTSHFIDIDTLQYGKRTLLDKTFNYLYWLFFKCRNWLKN
ncbi:DUF2334 domain-containing protein [Psychroserpens sp. S379A]|uniref:DUF2334 domain-containing protein n=1 Tax=Psychroserpens sp. S379A TaxID=3415137 RepID=UPI003C7B0CC2